MNFSDRTTILDRTHIILKAKDEVKAFNLISICSDLSIPIRSFSENMNEVGIDFMDFLTYKGDTKFRNSLINDVISLRESIFFYSTISKERYINSGIIDYISTYVIDFKNELVMFHHDFPFKKYVIHSALVSIFIAILGKNCTIFGSSPYLIRAIFRRGYFTDPRSSFYIGNNQTFKDACERHLEDPSQMEIYIKNYYEQLKP